MDDLSKKYGGTNVPPPPKFEWKYLVYTFLIISQVATWGLILYDKSRTRETFKAQETQINYLDSARNEVQKMYDASLIMIDEGTSKNKTLDSLIKTKDNEIFQLKEKVGVLLKKVDITSADIDSARGMIKRINERMFNYLVENEQLRKENKKLVEEKTGAVSENKDIKSKLSKEEKSNTELNKSNKELAKKVELASILTSSNIQLTPVRYKVSGKEVTTSVAEKADLIRISYDINENMVAASGPKVMYVCMYGPDNKPVLLSETDSGTFGTADGDEKVYSTKVDVNYIQGRKHNVKLDWKQKDRFIPGNYRIEIYYNGYLSGSGNLQLKK